MSEDEDEACEDERREWNAPQRGEHAGAIDVTRDQPDQCDRHSKANGELELASPRCAARRR